MFLFKLQQNPFIQVLFICFFWFASELIVRATKIPVSGGVLGLSIVLVLLMTRCIKIEKLKSGAELLFRDMLLFFIPAVLAVIEHQEFLGFLGVKILLVIVLSTIAVMVVTAMVVDYFYRIKKHAH